MSEPSFLPPGRAAGDIDVHLSYKIVELFSEGLYASPNKAVEELVSNSFDAGAEHVHVLISPNLATDHKNASIAVIDDGSGMGADELRQHWRIGSSNKRSIRKPPRGRQQIGKFGIGKLATYVLANRLTHVSKRDGKYFATSIDYSRIDRGNGSEIRPSKPIKLALRQLTRTEAAQAVGQWSELPGFKKSKTPLFGTNSPESWTISIMSDLKSKAAGIKHGRLRWILSTALPLRTDFNVWLNGEKIESSQAGKSMIGRWTIGKDLVDLPQPAPKTVKDPSPREKLPERRHGIKVLEAGRVTGYAEAYDEPLGGSSEKHGRSNGFFVYVRGRLINAKDGHFGISPNELRHGTFSRFRAVVHMDYLDDGLRSTRETVADSLALDASKDLLRAVFNHVRSKMDTHEQKENPESRLARRLAAGRASLSRKPIAMLARSVADGSARARHLIVPAHDSDDKREEFLSGLDEKVETADNFVTGITVGYDGRATDPIARFDTESMVLKLNAYHPFVAAFYEEFTNREHRQPLALLAMGEVLSEARLHDTGIELAKLEDFLYDRDSLLRSLSNESGRQSPFSIAYDLLNASTPRELEECVCAAFQSLGFEVAPIGRSGEPDGVATAILPAGDDKDPQIYKVSLEAKSKRDEDSTVSAHQICISGIVRQGRKHGCDHVVVVGQAFPTSKGDSSALAQEIRAATGGRNSDKKPHTITLITIKDLAKLTRLRPIKQIGLGKIRGLFECTLPEQSSEWIRAARDEHVKRPQFRKIIKAIKDLAQEFPQEPVKYPSLRTKLDGLKPPVKYQTDGELKDVCKAMAHMSQGTVWADNYKVGLDQSAENAIVAIERAIQEYDDEAWTDVHDG